MATFINIGPLCWAVKRKYVGESVKLKQMRLKLSLRVIKNTVVLLSSLSVLSSAHSILLPQRK